MKDETIFVTRARRNDPVRRRYDDLDADHWVELENIVKDSGLSLADVLESFPAFIRRRDLPRVLAHYELFKKIVDLPGSIVELGVYRGSGFFTWANFLETFCPGDRIRKVFGFDDFQGYSKFAKGKDDEARKYTEELNYYLRSDFDLINSLTKLHNDDNILRGVERCRIINGDICQTVPEFVSSTKGLRLCLLYIDTNLFEPTKIGLEYLYPLVVPGGIVAFNGYGQQPWEGEAKAIEEFFSNEGRQPIMRRFPFSKIPSAYFIKGGRESEARG